MAGRPDFTTPGSGGSGQTVATTSRPEVTHISQSNTASVAAGTSETVEIYAPVGSIYRVLSMDLSVAADATATTGDHQFKVQDSHPISVLLGRSSGTTALIWRYGTWRSADLDKRPTDAVVALEQLFRMTATENAPIRVQYTNNTDAAQDNTRRTKMTMQEDSY